MAGACTSAFFVLESIHAHFRFDFSLHDLRSDIVQYFHFRASHAQFHAILRDRDPAADIHTLCGRGRNHLCYAHRVDFHRNTRGYTLLNDGLAQLQRCRCSASGCDHRGWNQHSTRLEVHEDMAIQKQWPMSMERI